MAAPNEDQLLAAIRAIVEAVDDDEDAATATMRGDDAVDETADHVPWSLVLEEMYKRGWVTIEPAGQRIHHLGSDKPEVTYELNLTGVTAKGLQVGRA